MKKIFGFLLLCLMSVGAYAQCFRGTSSELAVCFLFVGESSVIKESSNELPKEILFESDEKSLTTKSISDLKIIISFLIKNNFSALIAGSGYGSGSREINLSIGQKLADQVEEMLVQGGVVRERISATSFGRERINSLRFKNLHLPDLSASLNSQSLQGQNWRERLDSVVQAELRQWLAADSSGLDEILPPAYPPALSIRQEVWETSKEFEDRVEAARTERRLTIERIEDDYRARVEQRNKLVVEYNKVRQQREAGLAIRRQELITAGLAILTPAVTLSEVSFDQQSGVLSISAQTDGLGRQLFAFKDLPQDFRRSALTETGLMKATPEFQVNQTGEISLKALYVQSGGTSARGTPSTALTSPVQLTSVTIPSQSPVVVEQGTVTVDRNQVEKILYRDENEILRRRLDEQRRQQEAALAAAETRAAQEIARILNEAQRAGSDVVRAPQSQVQEAHALVIGNSDYRGSARLENPTRDAQAMSAKLRALGFKVTELGNTNRAQMVKGLSEFTRTASKADLTLLFYAGHGMQVQGVNYMIPVDMNLNDPSQATLQAVSLSQVVEQYMPGKTKLVFLDACRDNPIVSAGVRGASKGLAPINVSEGTLIAYATKDGQTAEDGAGRNSPFTQALLEHLADPFDIGVVLRRVREKVMRATGGKQQPWEYGSLTGGELVLSAIRRK